MRLNVQARGIIKSGFVEYTFADDGMITYRGEVTAKVLFFSKTVPFQGTHQLDPAFLHSVGYIVGTVADFGMFKLTVMEIVAGIAKVNLEMPGYGAGTGVLNLTEDIIRIQLIDVKGRVGSYNIEIVAA